MTHKNQQILTSMLNSTPYTKDSTKYKQLTKKLAVFVGCSNVATLLVENQEFRELLHELDPRYIVPGRAAIRAELSRVLAQVKTKISQVLKKARKIHLCCDIWSKKGMTESFIGITAHFFANHQRLKATLAVRSFESPHTGERILHIVKAVLQEWDIPCHQVGKILTDNGSNMLKAFHDTIEDSNDDNSLDPSENASVAVVVEEDENLTNSTSADDMDQDDIELSHFEDNDFSPENDVSDFDNKELEHDDAFSGEDYQRLSCFPHTLQLIVAKFDDVKPRKEAISTSKRLVARFNKSVKATEMLVKLSGKKLIGDCPTRWSSTYLLLKRLLAVRTDLETVICKLEWDGLQARHWKAIENVVVLLEPFAEYTSLCGGEEYTSISCVVPVLMELKLHLEKVN